MDFNRECAGWDDLIGAISEVIGSVFDFHHGTESRFKSVGRCARTIAAARSLGLHFLFCKLRDGGTLTSWWWGGYFNLPTHVWSSWLGDNRIASYIRGTRRPNT